jgi:undecaprenyl-diphosphatase
VNYDLFKSINNLSGNSAIDSVMKFAANDVIYLAVVVLVGICLHRLWRRVAGPVMLTGVGLVLTFMLGLVAAALHPEKRPFQTHKVHQLVAHAGGQSFPSDHATAAFGIALAVGAFLSWRWGVLLFLLALLIGFARVYDGIHYPGDIGGSFLAALVGVGVVTLMFRLIGPRRREPSVNTVRAA